MKKVSRGCLIFCLYNQKYIYLSAIKINYFKLYQKQLCKYMDIKEFRDKFDRSSKAIVYKKMIVEHIIDEGVETLPTLAKIHKLSVPTVNKLVSELMTTGVLKNYGKLETSGGRHPYLYGLKPDSCCFLGVALERDKLNMLLVNFCGEHMREEMGIPFKFTNTPECLEQLCSEINRFIDAKGPDTRKCLVSVGVILFGRINPQTGYSYTYFNFNNKPLANILSKKIGVETYIDNDSRAAAYGEYMTHYKDVGANLLFLNVTWGLGLGVIIDGKLYSGKSGFSGEFGHIHAYENEILCNCGKKGCLETEASGSAMHRKFLEQIRTGRISNLERTLPSNRSLESVTLQELIEATKKEDILCIDILEEVATNLGKHVAGLINIFNPHVVVVGGGLANAGDYLMIPLTSAIRKYSLNMVRQESELRPSLLMRYAGVVGASLIARRRAVESL